MPDAELAYVPEEKITAYLLEPAHPEGGDKAAFLISFGFRVAAPDELRDALLRHAREGGGRGNEGDPLRAAIRGRGTVAPPRRARPGLPYGMVKEGGGGGAALRHRLPDEEEVRDDP
jgi:hypothetical protein